MTFTITVQPAGVRFDVARDEAILPAAIRQGIGLPYGCRDGACGSCKSRLLEGRVIHGAHQLKALSPAEEEAGLILTCCATPQTDCVVEARTVPGAGEFPVQKMPARVSRIDRVAPDVAILRLQLPANVRMKYHPGQYVEFILRDGSRRSYSIANAPHHEGPIELHIRHMPGGVFTDGLFGAREPPVKERDILRFEGPLGTFFLREDNPKPIILLASGTGFAPIKAIAEHIFHKRLNRDEPGKPARRVVLYWGCRAKRDLYLPELPLAWSEEQPNFGYVPVLSDASPADEWTGRTGFVHRAVMEDFADLATWQVYACGAPAMVDAARRDFTEQCGLPADEFFADAFTSQADLAK